MKEIKLIEFSSDKLLKNRPHADKLTNIILQKIPKNEKEIVFSFEDILLLNPSFLDQIISNFEKSPCTKYELLSFTTGYIIRLISLSLSFVPNNILTF